MDLGQMNKLSGMMTDMLRNTCGAAVGKYEGKPAVYYEYDLHCMSLCVIAEDGDVVNVLAWAVTGENGYVKQGREWVRWYDTMPGWEPRKY